MSFLSAVWTVALATVLYSFTWTFTPISAFSPLAKTPHNDRGNYKYMRSTVKDVASRDDEKYNFCPFSSWEAELLNECRAITSHTINPHKLEYIDHILQRLNGPAPQSFFVLRRAVHRALANGAQPNDLKLLQTTAFFLVKPGYKLVLYNQTDCSYDMVELYSNDGLPWEIVSVDDISTLDQTGRDILLPNEETRKRRSQTAPLSTLQIANQILDLVTDASEHQVLVDRKQIDELVGGALEQLSWTLGMDLRGRTSADASFLFALSGIQEEQLFHNLATISYYELLRAGFRPSLKSKYVLQIIEKHAASGTKGPAVEALYRVASDCLKAKGEHLDEAEMLDTAYASFDLLSPRPRLWLWRFAARQKKARNGSGEETSEDPMEKVQAKIYPSLPKFKNKERPLIVDLGCGLGTSALGLATMSRDDDMDTEISDMVCGGRNFTDYNYLGADLSPLAVQFASGIASRWDLQDRLAYSWLPADECLDRLRRDSPENIALIMIQFPTPFRLDTPTRSQTTGNSQLPTNAQSGMVSDDLLARVAAILRLSGGMLLVQSNCEDVAVTVRSRAMQQGMKVVELSQQVQLADLDKSQQTQRNLEWIRQGGDRAIGPGWSSVPLLPRRGMTETEVACHLSRTPMHRCLLSV